MELEEFKKVEVSELEEKIGNWRKQFVEDINENFVGKTFTDSIVAAAMIKSLVDDVQVIMQWCEILANKIKELEVKSKLV